MSHTKLEFDKMLYEMTLNLQYYNQQCVNRWNYNSTEIPALTLGSFGLASAAGFTHITSGEFDADTFAANIRGLMSSQVLFRSLEVRAIYDPLDFYELAFFTVSGGTVGTGMSPTQAYGYRSTRSRTDIRRATKRIVGICEENVAAGGVIEAGTITAMNSVCTSMAASLVYEASTPDITYQPCVVHKQKYNPATGLPDEDGTAYRYFPTLEEQLEWIATGISWQPYATVRTQTSRQYGRGA